jgi:hypothetical protein
MNIQAVYGRGSLRGEIIAWKCVFPVESNIKSRQFGYSTDNSVESCGSKDLLHPEELLPKVSRPSKRQGIEALNQAILYLDVSIKN